MNIAFLTFLLISRLSYTSCDIRVKTPPSTWADLPSTGRDNVARFLWRWPTHWILLLIYKNRIVFFILNDFTQFKILHLAYFPFHANRLFLIITHWTFNVTVTWRKNVQWMVSLMCWKIKSKPLTCSFIMLRESLGFYFTPKLPQRHASAWDLSPYKT